MDKVVTGYDQELMKGRFAKLKEPRKEKIDEESKII